jgi:hypothetical protein
MRNVLTAAAILLVGASTPAHAQGMGSTPSSKQATITGTVVDVSCKFGQGLQGPDHKMCAEICADRGIPLAILGNDGKLYIPASPAMPGDAQNARLKQFAEAKVKVSGKVFEAAGANAIQIASIEAVK